MYQPSEFQRGNLTARTAYAGGTHTQGGSLFASLVGGKRIYIERFTLRFMNYFVKLLKLADTCAMDWFFNLFLAIFLFAITTFTKKSVLRLGVLPQLHGQGTFPQAFWKMLDSLGLPTRAGRLWTTWPLWSRILEYVQKLRCGAQEIVEICLAYIPSSLSKTPRKTSQSVVCTESFYPLLTTKHEVVAVFHWCKNFFVLCTFSVPEDLRWGQCQLSQALLRSSGRFAPKALGEGFGMIWELWGFSRSTTYGWTNLPTHCNLDDETQQMKHPGRSRFTNGKEPC